MLGWFGSNANSGGMEVHIREICKNITSEELALTLIIPKGSIRIPRAKNIEIVEIPCTMRAKSIEDIIKNVSKFNKNIVQAFEARGFAFDIIHSHDWLCVPAAKALRKKSKKPWVHTIHSLEHIRAGEETNSKISRIEKSGILGADKIITVSNLMKKEMLKKYKTAPEKIEVIRNYTSMTLDKLDENNRIARKKRVLFVGRLALQKGIETLISAFPQILKKYPDTKLIIAGSGNLKNSLIALSKINGIEKSVLFKGHVTEKELKALYRNASVFVSPSVFEPFGITLLDSAEFGAPIIATKDTGAREIFSSESVAIVEPLKKGALAKKIAALLDSENKRAIMAKNAKHDLLASDSWKDISEKTKKAYMKAIANQ
ncbi:MAG: glycosyltransferase family 4 protein [Nanoarchaeota archaeon]|nr:glycosyltransferase family 4 protein [Nanoarchaeota archaeon]